MLAATTLTLAAGGSLMQAAYLGTAAAAIEIEHLGNIPMELVTLKRWLTSRVELGERRVSRTPPPRAEGLAATSQERRIGQQRVRIPMVIRTQSQGAAVPPLRERMSADSNVIPAVHDA
jgi:hypothetical protein